MSLLLGWVGWSAPFPGHTRLLIGKIRYCSFIFSSGKYRDGDEKKISPQPHYIASDFSEAVDYILKQTVMSGT